jgi:putative transposase
VAALAVFGYFRAMSAYRHGSHTVFSIHLHLVWITKYRKKVLSGPVAYRLRDMVREICLHEQVDIIKGHVSTDHIHLFVSIPPQVTISRLVQRLKGKTSFKLLNEFSHLRKTYWGRHFWARGYFCCSSGNVTDDIIKQYIESQDVNSDDGFKVEGDDQG